MSELRAPLALYRGKTLEREALEKLTARWTEREFWSLAEIELSLRIPRTFLIYRKAEQGEGWSGLALGRMFGTAVELFYIYVHPEARGLGLGRALLGAFLAHAIGEYQAEQAFLEVRLSNLEARALYTRLGFREEGRRKRYYSDGEDALVFAKDLSPHS